MARTFSVVVLCLLVLLAITTLAPAVSLAADWTVHAGAETDDLGGQSLRFYPANLTINQGDTVTWVFDSHDAYTVTFFADGSDLSSFSPLNLTNGCPAPELLPAGYDVYNDSTTTFSSGVKVGGSYSLTFSVQGSFTYYSAFNVKVIQGQINVLAPAASLPSTPSEANSTAVQDQEADRTAMAAFVVPAPASGQDNIHRAYAGYGSATDRYSFLRFFPSLNMTITNGDVVQWSWTDITPHIVTIVPEGMSKPPFQLPSHCDNPEVLNPSGPNDSGFALFDGTQVIGSGFKATGTYQVYFNATGTFYYYCALHDDLGMEGYITVQSAASSLRSSLGLLLVSFLNFFQ